MNLDIERTRFNMVEQQVRPWDVVDPRVLDVLGRVRREDFVPEASRALAFADVSLPIGHGECMMKPVVEGRVLQALAVSDSDSVLEIGTGSGFLTACLAALARDVVSVEIHPDLAASAECKLMSAGVASAAELIATLSAPASNAAAASSSVRMPPPTVSGIDSIVAMRRIVSAVARRCSIVALTSSITSSSMPSRL